MVRMVSKREIVIKKAKDLALSVLPDEINKPFGKELFFNPERSAICSVSFTGSDAFPEAESHDEYADVFFVLSGEEELFIGGKISDASEIQKGERRGKILVGAGKYIVSANDIVIIPQGGAASAR